MPPIILAPVHEPYAQESAHCIECCGFVALQVDKILGKTAPPDFIDQLRDLALKHHDLISVDVIRAYHFGQRFLVTHLLPTGSSTYLVLNVNVLAHP